ncbi:MAG: efflux RND transporter periplasmic adaptor subunit [Xanthomonadales bacterium]|nr:efflux RND transporter periplasmic adaptor subunit [Gammaproteobacteria bacterium]MBT8054889.1 efflux RND transporter periplasmic adaptor subunit [Gammaproteobacteria bacterium]NND58180.1 efflux RND transporter periplasmic adaptor subunit [Xanthomonadales bacterium]NNK50037.1 efflux RND transporter periplasmic adaptor subunit [Xanthomonadales bacterium]
MANSTSDAKSSQGSLSLRATVLICTLLILAASAALYLIFNTEPEVKREAAVRETAMLVEVTRAESGSFRPAIKAMGTVIPSREIMLNPRVSGEVIEISPSFVPGGTVKEGELLVRIDDADYRTTLLQRQSELQQAIAELEIEQGRQDIAERDFRQLQKEIRPENKALVLREPQLRSAQAEVQLAQAAEAQSQLELQRTSLKAPFDAQILSRQVNLGSQVSEGDALARLVGLDTYWIETTIPLDKLRWLSFSDGLAEQGSPVSVRLRNAWADGQEREGYLYRLVGELEDDTRMARALVAIEDPLARRAGSENLPHLMLGAFAECRILGREITGALRLKRDYVRAGDTVWLMRDGQLSIQRVDIVFQDPDYAYISSGLSARDQVVTSSLATVRDGARLRLKTPAEANAGSATAQTE